MEEDGSAKRRYARGGIAMTIDAAHDREERSGSAPRYPMNGQEPFRGRSAERELRTSYKGWRPEPTNMNRKIPKELAGIESAIKNKVDADRR